MKFASKSWVSLGLALAGIAASGSLHAQTGYGVSSTGNLFSFSLSAPGAATSIGNLGFTPVGIDFLPGSSTLYAIANTGSSIQLYTVNTSTAAATPVGSGFALSVNGSYDLTGSTSYAFDFNPTTLQGDGSARIRLITNNGTDLRLNSATGQVAAVDAAINGAAGATIGAAGYTNTAALTAGGTTALYDVDFTNDNLYLQNPPNAGTLVIVGALGVNVGSDVAFDILTAGSANSGYLVNTTGPSAASVYSVNLTTGAATSLGVVSSNFTGGFAVSSIPEPSTYAMMGGLAALALAVCARRRNGNARTGAQS